jgi:hypothetical protein
VGKFLPLLSLAGFFLGLTFWSPLARGISGSVLLRKPQPITEDESVRRLKVVFFWLATPWAMIFGGVTAWLALAADGSRGWMWLFGGIALVPLVTGIFFVRALTRRRTSSEDAV